jgi:F-type H+-transporting ATPase subunit alpha
MDIAKQIAIIFTSTQGHLDDIPVEKISEFEKSFFDYLDANNAGELIAISSQRKISKEVEAKLNEAILAFKGGFTT